MSKITVIYRTSNLNQLPPVGAAPSTLPGSLTSTAGGYTGGFPARRARGTTGNWRRGKRFEPVRLVSRICAAAWQQAVRPVRLCTHTAGATAAGGCAHLGGGGNLVAA